MSLNGFSCTKNVCKCSAMIVMHKGPSLTSDKFMQCVFRQTFSIFFTFYSLIDLKFGSVVKWRVFSFATRFLRIVQTLLK